MGTRRHGTQLLSRLLGGTWGAATQASAWEDDALREDLRFEELARTRWGARVFCWFAIALLIASAVNSYLVEPEIFPALLRIRLTSVLALGGIVALLTSSIGRRRSRELTLLFVLVLALTFHALALADPARGYAQYDRMNLVVLGLSVLITWTPAWAAAACGTMMAVYLLAAYTSGGMPGGVHFGNNLVRLIATSGITVGATAIGQRRRRREQLNHRALAEARERNRETQERYQRLVDTAGSIILAISPDHRILEFNREAENMYGWQRHEVIGRDYLSLFLSEELRPAAAAVIQRALSGDTVRGFESPVRARSGERRIVLWNITRLGGAGDVPLGVIAVGQDITARKHAEEEIRRLNTDLENRVLASTVELTASEERVRQHQEQLAHVLRVQTMGEMAAALAHELNQPLGAIVNYANGIINRLSNRGVAHKDLREAAAQIAKEGLRAGEIVRRARNFLRQGDTKRELSDVNQLVRDAARLVEPDARRTTVAIALNLAPELPLIEIDRIQVEQVILNLLRNGIDAMAATAADSNALTVTTSRHADYGVEVLVRDTGGGIAPNIAERIFDPFFTTKAGGLGMGLSISRSIIEAHGGRLWAAGNSDGGMTFGFRLPGRDQGVSLVA